MFEAFKNHIEINFPHLKNKSSLLACSGGVDSMVLASLFYKLRLPFVLAHCNFKLRGEASDGDEKLVRDFATSNKIKFISTSFDTIGYINKNKVSLQVGARELRYNWFAKVMEEERLETLVTAHHADDNLETFLINLSRGTGLEGLTGIPEKTESISRPLLPFSRIEILEFAKQYAISWREDASNKETKYLRNQIRHDLAPLLKDLNPSFLENFKKTQFFLNQSADILNDRISYLKKKLFIVEREDVKIKVENLLNLHPLEGYLYHLFNEYGFTTIRDLVQLTKSGSGKELQSKSHRLLRDREHLILTKIDDKGSNSYLIHEGVHLISEPISLKMELVREIQERDANILYVDKNSLKYPLEVRRWKNGDYFYPFGMKGKKKVSKFFKDEKLSRFEKEKQWLLCSGNKVVWIVGLRGDDRFKVTDSTTEILKFSLN
ncbi:tRNA lysidine(34) synthetase TilS [Euzebyella saccharophila]|uniref:tRNA(Ile)-lysidine synthase n=1 Tax=Euzebyella saccharophila TaxID=679664 RepID=A0ABV8JPX9_9FLAO|nr:tRNA lysidine(34) synthetase TilS [Euzebyella saccharophila]